MSKSSNSSLKSTGKLLVCPTPIGNLEDITLRVLRVLKEVDLVASEDTRRTRILLSHYGIHTPTLSYQEYNEEARGKQLVGMMSAGQKIALVSDAGMPGISDPGYRLIRSCIESGIEFEVLPGPDSITTALVLSGLPTNRFAFEGFLPRRLGARRKRLERIREEERTLVFYEAPSRLLSMLAEMIEYLGDRRAVVARELTKKFEEIVRGNFSEIAKYFESKGVKGEVVIVVDGYSGIPRTLSQEELESVVAELKAKEMSSKEMSNEIAKRSGISKREAYSFITKLRDRNG